MQDAIEAMLKEKLGLDANSVGSRIIARAVAQRQAANGVGDRSYYLALLRSSPEELNQLIEAVVIPETWFFRDKGPFEYLRHYVKEQAIHNWELTRVKPLHVLSVPCSTGEEPYSIAMTLLDAGFTAEQFRIDAVDVSQKALQQAEQAVYGKKSFRGGTDQELERYFEPTTTGYQIRSEVRKCVKFIHGNILEPYFLAHRKYHVIFCRNLLIYLDQSARDRTLESLDKALFPLGLLFLGSAEAAQMLGKKHYRSVAYPAAFAYQKQALNPSHQANAHSLVIPATMRNPLNQATRSKTKSPGLPPKVSNSRDFGVPSGQNQPNQQTVALLETAKQLADRGQLNQAAQVCKSYVQANPAEAPAYSLLGEICQGLNQPREAEQYFQKALYLDPSAYEALMHLALLKEQQGNQAASEKLKKRAQRLVEQGHPSF